MIHPRRHVLFLFSAVVALALAAAAVCVLRLAFSMRSQESGVPPPTSASLEFASLLPRGAFECIEPFGGDGKTDAAAKYFAGLQGRLRLAGFKLNRANPENSAAIIDIADGDSHRQGIYRKGAKVIPAVFVAGVGTNSVALSTPHGPCTLFLSRRGNGAVVAGAEGAPSIQEFASGAVSRLAGAETSPGTWHFRRQDVMDYYNEIKEREERYTAVFDTLAPLYYTDEADGREKIEGYRVDICGEEEFFKAIGFRQGDVIREVNGVRMTNRYAAEALIGRFISNDLDFVHVKLERDGEEVVQSYFPDM